MDYVTTITALRAAVAVARAKGQRIGLVPTMGALHEGHFSLVRESLARRHFTVVTIFVNPAQFGPQEDLSRYPRTLEADRAALEALGTDLLFSPDVSEIYPEGFATSVHVKGITDHLCGPFRPGHFDGVATVVTKLLAMAGADEAFFGEKDWQQLQAITRLARDLDSPTRIVGLSTVREADGLALSSRNRYLGAEARGKAALIPRMLAGLATTLKEQPQNTTTLLQKAREDLRAAGFVLDYLELADAQSCAPVAAPLAGARLFIAAKIKNADGSATRLIDNWPV